MADRPLGGDFKVAVAGRARVCNDIAIDNMSPELVDETKPRAEETILRPSRRRSETVRAYHLAQTTPRMRCARRDRAMPNSLAAAAIAAGVLASSAQAAPTTPTMTERDLFVSVCTQRMSARIAKQPEVVCGCLHDNAVSREEDAELRLALIRGVAEAGVPSIRYAWVPGRSPERVVEALDKVAAPTLACMFGPRQRRRQMHNRPDIQGASLAGHDRSMMLA